MGDGFPASVMGQSPKCPTVIKLLKPRFKHRVTVNKKKSPVFSFQSLNRRIDCVLSDFQMYNMMANC